MRNLSRAESRACVAAGDARRLRAGRAKAQNVPEIPYDSVPNFLKLPAGLYLGESMGVATNSKGHVFVYHPQRQHAPVRVRSDRRLRARNRASATTALSSRIPSASIPKTTSGSWTKAPTW